MAGQCAPVENTVERAVAPGDDRRVARRGAAERPKARAAAAGLGTMDGVSDHSAGRSASGRRWNGSLRRNIERTLLQMLSIFERRATKPRPARYLLPLVQAFDEKYERELSLSA